MPSITVYSNVGCNACNVVMNSLKRKGIEYSKEMIGDHPEVSNAAKEQGLMALPIVVVENEDGTTRMWSGPNTEEIKALERTCVAV